MDYIEHMIPVATFVLGVYFSIYIRDRSARKDRLEESIKELSELSDEWYGQIHEIVTLSRISGDRELLMEKIALYEKNRLVLPKYIRNIEYAREVGVDPEFVRACEDFLKMVTYPVVGRPEIKGCFGCGSLAQSFLEKGLMEAKRRSLLVHCNSFDVGEGQSGDLLKVIFKKEAEGGWVLYGGDDYLSRLDEAVQNISRKAAIAQVGVRSRWMTWRRGRGERDL